MRKITTQRNLRGILTLIIIFLCFTTYSQVGIGNTNPDPDSLLEVGDGTDTQGILLPRVSLTATNDPSPLSTDVAGMIVYNTTDNGSGSTQVYEGFYYNDGTDWIRLAPGQSDDWSITGNNNTVPATNYIGSSNAVDVVLATAGSENMRLVNGGQVSVNDPTPIAGDLFTAVASGNDFAVNGYASGTGAGVYGDNSSTGDGVVGVSVSGAGTVGLGNAWGVWGETASNGYGVYGIANNAGGIAGRMRNLNATGISMVVTGQAQPYLAYTGGAATFSGTNGLFSIGTSDGLLVAGNSLTPTSIIANTTGTTSMGENFGIVTWSNNSSGTGIVGMGNGLTGASTLVGGSGLAGSGTNFGVVGFATTAPPDPGYSAGGYFSHGTGWAAVGGYYQDDPPGPTNNSTAFKIIGNGIVSTIVKGLNNEDLVMACPEAPEVLFQDYGIGTLVNGYAKIIIDPILTKNILVDEDHPLKVFIQLEGDCNGVYVTNKSSQSFEVKELQGGTSSVDFSWSIVATRAQEVLASIDGKSSAKIANYSWRFLNAPSPLEIITAESKKVDAVKEFDENLEKRSLSNSHKKSKD
jgi:hypothetical protein